MTQVQAKDRHSEAIWGVVLILAGGAFLLSNFDVLEADTLWRHWPLAFVVVGILKLTAAHSVKDIGPPMWWIFIGAWLYVSVFEYFGLGFSRSWPLLIIGWGISTLWSAFTRKPHHVWD